MILLKILKDTRSILCSIVFLFFSLDGYAFSTFKNIQLSGIRAQDFPMVFNLSLNGRSASISDGSETKAITNALNTWSSVMGSHVDLRFSDEMVVDLCGDIPSDRYINDPIRHVLCFSQAFSTEVTADPSVVAVGGFIHDEKKIVRTFIVYNEELFRFKTDSANADDVNAMDLESISLHEIGHTIGLNHSTNKDAIMYHRSDSVFFSRVLSSDDINGARYLYPSKEFFGGIGCGSISYNNDESYLFSFLFCLGFIFVIVLFLRIFLIKGN